MSLKRMFVAGATAALLVAGLAGSPAHAAAGGTLHGVVAVECDVTLVFPNPTPKVANPTNCVGPALGGVGSAEGGATVLLTPPLLATVTITVTYSETCPAGATGASQGTATIAGGIAVDFADPTLPTVPPTISAASLTTPYTWARTGVVATISVGKSSSKPVGNVVASWGSPVETDTDASGGTGLGVLVPELGPGNLGCPGPATVVHAAAVIAIP